MSQWAEIRHMHIVDGVPKKEIARRLGLDIKTVRRAVERETAPTKRESPRRARRLDPWREQITGWLLDEPKISAKRIGRLLPKEVGPIQARTIRKYVAELRGDLSPKEAFVHRTHALGDTMEADFGESWAVVGGKLHKVKFLVVTLPGSNTYFAKAYPVERVECLLDGLATAFVWFGGLPRRVVLDNTSLAVKKVLKGTERIENQMFHGFRGGWPVHADFCAPGKGWEKGSVERGVEYVRANVFRPMPNVDSWDALNAQIMTELEHDLDQRRLPDGRTARQAQVAEREHLRPLPDHRPETCRVLTCVANKYGQVHVDRSTYSVPVCHARRPVTVKLFHDQVVIACGGEVVARHERTFREGSTIIDPLHVLELLEKKHRAVSESTAIQQWQLPQVFHQLRAELHGRTRKPDQEWVRILRLLEEHPPSLVELAVTGAIERGSPRLETVQMLLRQESAAPRVAPPLTMDRTDLLAIEVAEPDLSAWDTLCAGGQA
ncbi:MAG: IS21 family transposase [bacterium]|nr:IS21 family transposase [bacterium]